jgi:hypothetical protein
MFEELLPNQMNGLTTHKVHILASSKKYNNHAGIWETVTQGVLLCCCCTAAICYAALGKREKQRLAQQQSKKQQQEGGTSQPAAAMDSSAAAAAFTRLTELADLLLNAGGELGIYSQRKEQLERFAKAVLPETDVLAGDDGGDDMFGDDDDDDVFPKKSDGTSEGKSGAAAVAANESDSSGITAAAAGGSSTAANGGAPQAAAAAAAAGTAAAAEAEGVDYSSWPVKELRRFLKERGVDSSSIVEKGDLVNQVGFEWEDLPGFLVRSLEGHRGLREYCQTMFCGVRWRCGLLGRGGHSARLCHVWVS